MTTDLCNVIIFSLLSQTWFLNSGCDAFRPRPYHPYVHRYWLYDGRILHLLALHAFFVFIIIGYMTAVWPSSI